MIIDTIGLDQVSILDEMDGVRVGKQISNVAALAQKLRITGTPALIVDRSIIRGYANSDTLKQYVKTARNTK